MKEAYTLPSFSELETLSAADVGNLLLPLILRQERQAQGRGFVANDFAIVVARQYFGAEQAAHDRSRTGHGPSDLIMEGLSFLERAGLLIPLAFEGVGKGLWIKLSRSGLEAANARNISATAVGSIEARRLLHPRVSAECLREIERGPEGYDDAIFKAFRQVEIALHKAMGSPTGLRPIDLVNAAFSPPGGRFIDPTLDANEARGIRDLFAGAIAFLRNPPAHREIGEDDPHQVMRHMLFASNLLVILERLAGNGHA